MSSLIIEDYDDEQLLKRDGNLIARCEALGMVAPRVVFAQTYLETDRLRSRIYKENHNRFGMKHNGRGYSKYERLGHAYYDNEVDSMLDYMAWQKQMLGSRIIKSDTDYLNFLNNLPGGRRYAEDKRYTEKLRKIILKLWGTCS